MAEHTAASVLSCQRFDVGIASAVVGGASSRRGNRDDHCTDASTTDDAAQLRSMASRRSVSAQGVGQVQLVLDGWPDLGFVREVSTEILTRIPSETLWLRPEEVADRPGAVAPAFGDEQWPRDTGGTS